MSEGLFELHCDFEPSGDQPTAIAELIEGIDRGEDFQVLLGATGTGKTFTVAQVIARTQRPTLVLAPNKTLAAQLYGEFSQFFPKNAVSYFVSYYDYYQPEAYVPSTNTFIEKDSQINEAIDRMLNPDTLMGTSSGIYDLLGRWDDHIHTWTHAAGLPLHVVRYEDLLASPGKAMRGLLEKFLRVKVDGPKLARAVKATSFEAMRKQEEALGFVERPQGMQKFFARGQAGVWREDLSPAQVGRLRDGFLPALEKWYPEMLKETEAFAASA